MKLYSRIFIATAAVCVVCAVLVFRFDGADVARAQTPTTITFNSNSASNGQSPSAGGIYSWTAPAGVSSIALTMWGGGGNGGGLQNFFAGKNHTSGNGGGGGGLLTSTVAVTPGQTYYLHVGSIRTSATSPTNSFCGNDNMGVTDSWFTNQSACPYINSALYLEVEGGLIGGDGGKGGGSYTLPGSANPYYANGATNVTSYSGGLGGAGVLFGSAECDVTGGGGGAAGGGIGATGSGAQAGTNGTGPALGGGNGGNGGPGSAPGGGGGGSCGSDFDSFGGAGRVILSYTVTSPPSPNFIDIGLRVNQGTSATPDIQHIAIEDPAGSPSSTLYIAKNGVIYHVALVDPADANATKVKITLTGGTVKALRACTTVAANSCTFVP